MLEDGEVLRGESIGARGCGVGELVFNTAMSGYQEILTDPSYAGQIITLTCAHVGNVGVNREDDEAAQVAAAGLIVRDCPAQYSNWRAERSLPDFLRDAGVVAVAGLDTRRITRMLRARGAMGAALFTDDVEPARARAALAAFAGLEGADLASQVSCDAPREWRVGAWRLAPEDARGEVELAPDAPRVIAYDFGVKRNILRLLTEQDLRVRVVPARTPAREVLAEAPAGVFLSNGPGDPDACPWAIDAIGELLDAGVPLFGICLGHQLLGLACGARTVKMKFGHHGANHPVLELDTGRTLITSQNHGFCVEEDSLPDTLRPTHRSLFDGSLQGARHARRPAFGFQGHPEASPGPHDVAALFAEFAALARAHAQAH